jgi:phosphocarrier protein
MVVKVRVKVLNRVGLHARPAAVFVQTARKFKSRIQLYKDEKFADAKNILQVLALGVDCGDEIEIVAEGEDEATALGELVKIVESLEI